MVGRDTGLLDEGIAYLCRQGEAVAAAAGDAVARRLLGSRGGSRRGIR